MFVACIVLDDGYGERIRGKDDTESTTGTNADNSQGTQQNIPQIPEYQKMNEENIYAFQKDYKVATDLYELLYIDTPGGISCPGASMLKKLLNEQMYTRWLDYKTVEGLTHHSFVWVTSGADVGVRESVVNPFLVEYTQMVALCLVQRASIMAFQDKATEIAKEMRNIDKNTVSKTNELIKLQSR